MGVLGAEVQILIQYSAVFQKKLEKLAAKKQLSYWKQGGRN